MGLRINSTQHTDKVDRQKRKKSAETKKKLQEKRANDKKLDMALACLGVAGAAAVGIIMHAKGKGEKANEVLSGAANAAGEAINKNSAKLTDSASSSSTKLGEVIADSASSGGSKIEPAVSSIVESSAAKAESALEGAKEKGGSIVPIPPKTDAPAAKPRASIVPEPIIKAKDEVPEVSIVPEPKASIVPEPIIKAKDEVPEVSIVPEPKASIAPEPIKEDVSEVVQKDVPKEAPAPVEAIEKGASTGGTPEVSIVPEPKASIVPEPIKEDIVPTAEVVQKDVPKEAPAPVIKTNGSTPQAKETSSSAQAQSATSDELQKKLEALKKQSELHAQAVQGVIDQTDRMADIAIEQSQKTGEMLQRQLGQLESDPLSKSIAQRALESNRQATEALQASQSTHKASDLDGGHKGLLAFFSKKKKK